MQRRKVSFGGCGGSVLQQVPELGSCGRWECFQKQVLQLLKLAVTVHEEFVSPVAAGSSGAQT